MGNPLDVARRGVTAAGAGVMAGVRNIPANIGAELQGARIGGQFGSTVGGVFGAGIPGGFLGGSAGAIIGGVTDSVMVGSNAALHSFFGG